MGCKERRPCFAKVPFSPSRDSSSWVGELGFAMRQKVIRQRTLLCTGRCWQTTVRVERVRLHFLLFGRESYVHQHGTWGGGLLEDNVPLKRAAVGIHVAWVENLHIARKHRTPCTLTTMLDTRSTYFFCWGISSGSDSQGTPRSL